MKPTQLSSLDPSIAACIEYIGAARHILLLGRRRPQLLQALSSVGCEVTYRALSGDERSGTAQGIAGESPRLGNSHQSNGVKFEVVLVDEATEEPEDLLDLLRQTHDALVTDGFLVAMLARTTQQDVREVIRDVFAEAGYGFVRVEYVAVAPALSDDSQARAYSQIILVKARRTHLTLPLASSKVRLLGSGRPDPEAAFDSMPMDIPGRSTRELRLQIALGIARVTAIKSDEARVRAEEGWFELYRELEETREEAKVMCLRMLDAVDVARAERDAIQRQIDATSYDVNVARDAIERIEILASKLSEALEESELLKAELEAIRTASLSDKAVMQQYVETLRDRSEQLESRLRGEFARFEIAEREMRERMAEYERRMDEENRDLRARVADAEYALAAQTDALIASMQTESAQLSKLVDTAQSSRFWKFKRWLNRLRGAIGS